MTLEHHNPSLAMASNAYRRLYGSWPTAVRFSPEHFAYWVTEVDPETLTLLATAFDLLASTDEQSPRLTVMGPAGQLTYDEGVTSDDYDNKPFVEMLRSHS